MEKDTISCELVDRVDAAKILGIKPETLSGWVCRGKTDLPYIKIGGRVRYKISDLKDFIKRNTIEKE